MKIADIKVGDRYRKDLGDIEGLAASIRQHGLIHPIVVDDKGNLIAGGRRLAAVRLLGWEEVPVTLFRDLSEFQVKLLELEENIRRKDVTWQERVIGIATAHKLLERQKTLEGERWLQEHTGELLGISQASVSYALTVAKCLQDGDREIAEAESLSDALTVLAKRKEAALASELIKRAATPPAVSVASVVLEDGSLQKVEGEGELKRVVVPLEGEVDGEVCINNLCTLGDAAEILTKLPDDCYHHIFTDPPYNIDEENFTQRATLVDFQTVKEEHKKGPNLDLIALFIKEAYRITCHYGFCFMWGDLENYDFIRHRAEEVGWRFQRWPLVWIKTTPCMNNAGSCNFTKTYEVCYVLRKEGAMLRSFQQTAHWIGAAVRGKDHPFQKPVELWKWLMQSVCLPQARILDPFAGTGSSLIAALQLGLLPHGIEINKTLYASLLLNLKSYVSMLK